MASRLEKLLMRIELIDKITAPVNRINAAMDKLTKNTALGFANITGGVAGMWGVGVAIQGMTNDYREFHKEVMGVKTLGVADETLKKLERSALSFSIKYGESAAAFVSSSYDIQSAIAGLSGNELVKFTEAGNILAKGSKADANTITNYMGTMYGIFQNTADKMGRAQWVELLAGQTSMAVDIFKSDGMQMSAAFTSLGADAQAHGIAMHEQMAILGQLQATMSGSEAGTKYKAFLRGVGAAQEKLGLQFTDSAGRMLPVEQILGKLQNKFGAIDTVAKSDALKKAFGSDEAVATIKLLMNNTTGLTSAIAELGKVTGMEQAIWKAQQLTDAQERLNQASIAVKIGYGALITQALLPLYEFSIQNLSVLSEWIDKYPHLFGLLAKLTVWVGVVVAAVSALAIAKGMAMIAMVGFSTALTILKSPLYVVRAGIWLWNASLAATRILLLTTALRFPVLITGLIAMKAAFIAGATSAWAFAAALLANPITWIVVGVVALIAGLVMLVKHWDTVKAATLSAVNFMLEKWQAFRAVIEDNPVLKFIFQPLLLAADFVGFLIKNLNKIPEWFSSFKNWLAELNIFDGLMNTAKAALETVNLLPGVNIDTSSLQSNPAQQAAEKTAGAVPPQPLQIPMVANIAQPAPVTIPAVMQIAQPANTPAFSVPLAAVPTAPAPAERLNETVEREREKLAPRPDAPQRNVPQGGLLQQINNSSNNSNSGTSIGTLNVNTTQKVDGYSLRDQLLMSA